MAKDKDVEVLKIFSMIRAALSKKKSAKKKSNEPSKKK
jgi:hypothetical protein